MKKLIITAIFMVFIINSSLKAQTGIHFGLKAGYSSGTQYGINQPNLPYEVNSSARAGFTGGILLYYPITDAFGVQQEFLYTQKGSGQDVIMTNPPISTFSDYRLNYFELPILFKYNFINIKNFEIYGSTGFCLSILLNGDYKVDGVIDMGPGGQIPFEESGNTDGLDEFDYSFVYGLGFKFNLFDQKCFFDYRQTIGWNTLMMPSAEGGEPVPLRNQTYSFTLGIIF